MIIQWACLELYVPPSSGRSCRLAPQLGILRAPVNSLPDDPRTRTDHGQLMKGGRGELFLGKVQGQPKPINPGLLRQNGQQLLLDSTGNRREFPADRSCEGLVSQGPQSEEDHWPASLFRGLETRACGAGWEDMQGGEHRGGIPASARAPDPVFQSCRLSDPLIPFLPTGQNSPADAQANRSTRRLPSALTRLPRDKESVTSHSSL